MRTDSLKKTAPGNNIILEPNFDRELRGYSISDFGDNFTDSLFFPFPFLHLFFYVDFLLGSFAAETQVGGCGGLSFLSKVALNLH